MSALLNDPEPRQPRVRILPDSRPPSHNVRSDPPPLADHPARINQPALTFGPTGVESPPRPSGHRVHVVSSPCHPTASSVLPDARSWSASLALAVAEALQGRRPIGQLSRWVDEQVLATLTVALRQRRQRLGAEVDAVRPAMLRSVHLQFPQPDVVEVSAHVLWDGRSQAFAFRLQAWYDRWLCTALELGPRSLAGL